MDGPKTKEELEVWRAYHVALVARGDRLSTADKDADWLLRDWVGRRDEIEAAEREATESHRRATREALNAAEWVRDSRDPDEWDRWAMGKRDGVDLSRRQVKRFERDMLGFCAAEWPADMGNPPPGWNGGAK